MLNFMLHLGLLIAPINAHSFAVMRPTYGETLNVGVPYTLKWLTAQDVPKVNLVLRSGILSNSTVEYSIANGINNTGEYVWSAPWYTKQAELLTLTVESSDDSSIIDFSPYFVVLNAGFYMPHKEFNDLVAWTSNKNEDNLVHDLQLDEDFQEASDYVNHGDQDSEENINEGEDKHDLDLSHDHEVSEVSHSSSTATKLHSTESLSVSTAIDIESEEQGFFTVTFAQTTDYAENLETLGPDKKTKVVGEHGVFDWLYNSTHLHTQESQTATLMPKTSVDLGNTIKPTSTEVLVPTPTTPVEVDYVQSLKTFRVVVQELDDTQGHFEEIATFQENNLDEEIPNYISNVGKHIRTNSSRTMSYYSSNPSSLPPTSASKNSAGRILISQFLLFLMAAI